MPQLALITGATSGFGKACAELFAQNGWNLILTGRRTDRLQTLEAELTAAYNVSVLTLTFDVREKDQVNKALQNLPEPWQHVDVLINNAGLALGRERFDEADPSDWETMIDTNLKGLLYVTRAVLPYMVLRKKGHIINIGSVAAKDTYESGNVYCATKAAVDTISKSMRIDLLNKGLKVTAIHPGAAETEFSEVRFKGDKEKASAVYEGYKALTAQDVASVVYYTATLPEHICINDLVLTCTAQANAFYTHKG
jgi:NADP-dependent 3-hydroxy acid dehydrogenase YdfG